MKNGSSSDAFAYSSSYEEPRKKGIRFGPFPLFLLAVAIIASLATIITLTVLFTQQAADLENFKKNATITTVSSGSSVSGSTTPNTPSGQTSVTTSGPPTSMDWPSYRLPGNIDTLQYKVFLQVFLPFDENSTIGDGSKNFTTQGNVTIDFTVKEPVRLVVLHSWNLTITEGSIMIADSNGQNLVQKFQFDEQRHLLKILLSTELLPGRTHQMAISFVGKIVDDNQGLYRSSYMVNGKKRFLATSQFEAYKLRRVFPCFDEPSYRAIFYMELKYNAQFNGTYFVTQEHSSNIEDTPGDYGIIWKTTKYRPTVRMAPYALAFVISDFERKVIIHGAHEDERIITNVRHLEFGGISRPDAIDDTDFATKLGLNMTLFMGSLEFLNEPYSRYNTKMDQLASPDFDSGAMENLGLIIYREKLMLYRPGSSSAEDKKEVGRVVAHELAHQWFGNILTCQWWSEIFLNEGFATFMEFPVVMHAKPDWNIDKLFTISETKVAFDADSYATSHPLWNPNVFSRADIDNMFSRITYQKGGSILRMIETVMGRQNFYAALRNYFQINKMKGSVTPPDLLNALTEQMNGQVNITERFDKWLTTNGFPLVSITGDATNMTQAGEKYVEYTVSQQRFMLGNASATPGQMNRTWHIPLHFQTKDRSTGNLTSSLGSSAYAEEGSWLVSTSRNIQVMEHDWILANIGQKGFYRVNYTAENWAALTDQLKTDHEVIDMLSRNQLVDDSFVLARIGQLNYSIPISMTQYLAGEYEYPPWFTAFDQFNYINRMLGGTEDLLKDFVLSLLNPRYSDSLWDTTAVWIDEVKELYINLTMNIAFVENSCFYGSSLCLSTATNKFAEFKSSAIDDSDYKINPHLKDQIYCYGMRTGNVTDFNFLELQYISEPVQNSKLSILKGMACANDTELIARYFNMTLDEEVVRAQDINYAFRYATKFPATNVQAWEFFKANWDEIPEGFRDNIIVDVAGKFSSQQQYDDVQRLFNEKGGPGSGISEEDAFKQALTRIASNIEWVSKYSGSILTALEGVSWNSGTTTSIVPR